MHTDEAAAFILDFIGNPRASAYGAPDCEIYLPNVIAAHLVEREQVPQHSVRDHSRMRELLPIFLDTAWEFCRRGILRPAEVNNRVEGRGFSITSAGRAWLDAKSFEPILVNSSRLAQLFEKLSTQLGRGFQQRASEAANCHALKCYLASCAMCGAAAESVVLSVAIAKTRDEERVLKIYQATHGRRNVINSIIEAARPGIVGAFRAATDLLSYWRDEAAHGTASEISEIEAYTALHQLLRFAQFVCDNWAELTDGKTPSA
jgi:hypothetical protein